jgi:hypothetical protein
MSAGGKLVLSYKSALKPGKDQFYFDIGNYKQDSFFNPEYIQISEALLAHDRRGNLIKSPFVIYGGSVDIETGSEVWAYKINPYLNRTREHFCSHHHFPEHTKSDFPAAVINKGNIVYFANSIFTQYAEYGQMLFRDTVIAAMDKAIGELSFYSSLGSSGRVSLMHQPQKNRFILHLLYAVPVKRAGNAIPSCGLKDIEVIEDIVPLRDVSCSIKFDRNIKKVYQALANKEINWSQSNGRINLVVDEINCHQLIVFEY